MSDKLGYPEELNFSVLKSMHASRKTEYRKNPINGAEFTTPGEQIQLVLNKMDNTFYDPNTLYITGVVEFTGMTGSISASETNFVLGCFYSLFSRQVVKSLNGQTLETIENPSLLVNSLMNMTTNASDKQGLSTSFGFNSLNPFTNLGCEVKFNGKNKYSFSLPIIGVLNSMKMIPSFVSDIEIDLTLNQLSSFMINPTATAASIPTGYKISGIEIVCEALTLESASFQNIMALYPNIIKVKSSSYLYGGSSLNANSQPGTYDINYTHSLNSLKQFIFWSSPSNAMELNYSGVNPNLENYSLVLGSVQYPTQGVKCRRASECYMQNEKSFASVYSASASGSSTRDNFCKASTAYDFDYSAYYTKPTTVVDMIKQSSANKWCQMLDVEVINNNKDSLFTGVSTRGSSNTLRLNINTPLAAVEHKIHFYSHFDCILEFDYVNQVINLIS